MEVALPVPVEDPALALLVDLAMAAMAPGSQAMAMVALDMVEV